MSKESTHASLISGRSLAKNTVWNLLGSGLPLLAGIAAIPVLIKGLGVERFGVLTLAWMVIGYFNLFDLGLGRALTKLVSEKLGAGQTHSIPPLTWTALTIMTVLGVIGALLLTALSPWLVYSVLKIPEALQPEATKAFYLLALSIPIVISTIGLRGLLEAYQRFGLINAVRVPMGLFTFLGPLFVLLFSNSLYPVVAVLLAGRCVALVIHLGLCLKVVPGLWHGFQVRRDMVKRLLSFGGWMTISNIIGPLLVYLDRFLIGALISVVAVAYYTTPYEVVTKLWIIPSALVGVLFPAFCITLNDDHRIALLFSRGVNYIFIALFPIAIIIVIYAHETLTFWLGKEFADNSSFVLQWLVVGVFINSLARVPFALIQGAGRPDLTAKVHLIELPSYFFILWWLLGSYGILGAAIAWVARITVDTLVMFSLTLRIVPSSAPFVRRMAYTMGLALFVITLGAMMPSMTGKTLFLLLTLVIFAPASWFLVLGVDERILLRKRLRAISVFN